MYLTQADGEFSGSHALLYITYTNDETDAEWQVQANGSNKFVFNTEAHPIRIKA